MSKDLMRRLTTWLLVLSFMAAPVWSKSDFLEKVSKRRVANGYAFRPNGLASVADDDAPATAKITPTTGTKPQSLGSLRRVYDIAGP